MEENACEIRSRLRCSVTWSVGTLCNLSYRDTAGLVGDVWLLNAVSPHFRNTFVIVTAVILFVPKGPSYCR